MNKTTSGLKRTLHSPRPGRAPVPIPESGPGHKWFVPGLALDESSTFQTNEPDFHETSIPSQNRRDFQNF